MFSFRSPAFQRIAIVPPLLALKLPYKWAINAGTSKHCWASCGAACICSACCKQPNAVKRKQTLLSFRTHYLARLHLLIGRDTGGTWLTRCPCLSVCILTLPAGRRRAFCCSPQWYVLSFGTQSLRLAMPSKEAMDCSAHPFCKDPNAVISFAGH